MTLSASAQKVQDALNGFGISLQVVELPDSTRTAVEAAQAIGCSVGQIVKSLIFKAQNSGKAVLVIASGPNRVNENVITNQLGEPIGRADADFVRAHTGFVIGGVPPLGLSEKMDTFIDQDLLQYEKVWAAAGNPHAVFGLTPAELLRIVDGKVISVL